MPAIEQRRFRRFAVRVPCLVKRSRAPEAPMETRVHAETRDISRGGLSFVAKADWQVGTEIECVIHLLVEPLPNKPVQIQCSGKIVRVVPRKQGGMEVAASIEHFSYLPTGHSEQLATL